MPISRVRSVTVTSMMFITPIPPTSSEIAATAPSRTVKVCCDALEAAMKLAWFRTRKSGWLSVILCVLSSVEVISASACEVTLPDFASVTIWLIGPVIPVSVFCTVEIGAIAMSSWLVRPWLPFDLSTPTT